MSAKAVLISLPDVGAVVKAKGGTTGAAAYAIVPDTITNKVFGDLASKLKDGLDKEGVFADVKVINMPDSVSESGGILKDLLFGGGALAVGFGIAYLLFRKKS